MPPELRPGIVAAMTELGIVGRVHRAPGQFPDYDSVAALPVSETERLLTSGDGPERVWAAWSLGMRLGASATPILASAAKTAPDPGVRARLVVVLAGHGQREALTVLATDDPDDEVRAAACRHLAGTSLPHLSWVRDLLEDRLAKDRAAAVQAVLLDLVINGLLSIGTAQLAEFLQHDAARVRERAARIVIAGWAAGMQDLADVSSLLSHDDPAIRAEFAWLALQQLGPAAYLALLAKASNVPTDVAVWHLERLSSGTTVRWSTLAPVAARWPDAANEVLRLVESDDVGARPWLIRLVANHVERISYLAWPRIHALLAAAPLSAEEIAAARHAVQSLEETLAEPPEWETLDEDDLADWGDWRSELARLRAALSHAITSTGAPDN
jgi:hypothetical protein